jgi:threonine dehydrogenase-like Zn-dependent dehydrogenase
MYAPRRGGVEDRPGPKILAPTDGILRLSATCICGSDLWPYWGIESIDRPRPMGQEYVGIVEEVGSEVRRIRASRPAARSQDRSRHRSTAAANLP